MKKSELTQQLDEAIKKNQELSKLIERYQSQVNLLQRQNILLKKIALPLMTQQQDTE